MEATTPVVLTMVWGETLSTTTLLVSHDQPRSANVVKCWQCILLKLVSREVFILICYVAGTL